MLLSYGAATGEVGAPPNTWPANSNLDRRGGYTLLLFAHPLCPCTSSTLAELERLLAVCDHQVVTHVLFIAPDNADSKWRDSKLIAKAKGIAGVEVHLDAGRRETGLFGARTSGSCLLYDPAGRLVFNGGLTFARGHEGDNAGSQSIRNLVQGKCVDFRETPIFGCGLFEPSGTSIPTNTSSQ